MNGIFQFCLRATLGAVLGANILLVKLMIDSINANPYNVLLVGYLPIFIFVAVLIGAAVGTAVGTLLCFLSTRFRTRHSWPMRSLLGTSVSQILFSPLLLAALMRSDLSATSGAQRLLSEWFLLVVVTGGSAGLLAPALAGPKPPKVISLGGVVR
jgi:hypothetical protein